MQNRSPKSLAMLAATASLAAVVLSTASLLAQPAPKPQPDLAEAGAKAAPAGAWCGIRPRMNVVMTYDAGKNFGAVADKTVVATQRFVDTLCPGDVVRLSEFGLKAAWMGDAVIVEGDAERDKLVKAIRTRPWPKAPSSVNELSVKLATTWWEEQLTEDQMPVLAVFTDTMESDAPRTVFVVDFDWNVLPNYFENRFMTVVTVLDRRSTQEAGTIFVTSFPEGFDRPADLPSGGGTTSYADVMETFIPEPEPVVPEPRVIIKNVEIDRTPTWLTWLGTLPGSLTAGGAFFALGLLLFAAGRRSRKRRDGPLPTTTPDKHETAQVTLLLRDNLNGTILQQETRLLSHPLRVAPASNADFVIPGPYAFELFDEGGDAPQVRGANMLGIEILRAPDRRITLAEGDTLAIKTGDRINIGAGHEVEVQL